MTDKRELAVRLLAECDIDPTYVDFMFASGGTDDGLSQYYGSVQAQIGTILLDNARTEWLQNGAEMVSDSSLGQGIMIMNQKSWSLHVLSRYDHILRLDRTS